MKLHEVLGVKIEERFQVVTADGRQLTMFIDSKHNWLFSVGERNGAMYEVFVANQLLLGNAIFRKNDRAEWRKIEGFTTCIYNDFDKALKAIKETK